jgi:hypothetical protein
MCVIILLFVIGLLRFIFLPKYNVSIYVDTIKGNDKNSGMTKKTAFRTIEKARDKIRTINKNMESDIHVYLLGGVYNIDKTINFDSRDSGNNGYKVIYEAYKGEKPIISAGQKISKWTLYDEKKNIYEAYVSNLDFRQCYINGKLGVRARTPNIHDKMTSGSYYISDNNNYPFIIDESKISNYSNLKDSEFIWIAHWSQNRGVINSFTRSGDKVKVNFQEPEENYRFINAHNQKKTYFYLENSYSFLDSEGEWYIDNNSKKLYYKPTKGEDMSTADIIVPKDIQTLINVEGNSTKKVHDITFRGITFKYSNWITPSKVGYFTGQGGAWIEVNKSNKSNIIMNKPVPGMLQLKYSSNIIIERNTFKDAAANAIVSFYTSNGNSIVGNVITDAALGGIYIGIGDAWNDKKMEGASQNDIVKDNYISNCSRIYEDGVGIFATFPKNIIIEHNDISNLPGMGISIGFEWSDKYKGAEDNKIQYNKIYNVGQLGDDVGGIYTLGKMVGTSIKYNYIYDLIPSQYNGGNPNGTSNAGIYLDKGSCYKTVEYNVINNCGSALFAGNLPNYQNIFKYNYYNCKLNSISKENKLYENNLIDAQNWPKSALNIMKSSGLEGEYSNINR